MNLPPHHQATKLPTNVELLMCNLARFFADRKNTQVLQQYIDSKAPPLSLRTIDFFVTKYSQNRNIVRYNADGERTIVNVFLSYKAQLKAFHKKLFDPFRRHSKIVFYFDENTNVVTTIAQLNFFRWLIQNDILSYISEHKREIQAEMDAYHSAAAAAAAATCDDESPLSSPPPLLPGATCAPPVGAFGPANVTYGTRIVRFE